MHSSITESRDAVAGELESFIREAPSRTLSFEPWGSDVARRLAEYALRGKLIRGALVGFAYRLYHPEEAVPAASAQAGAAMELLQSFLLVHDDIMDQDDLRRGRAAVHSQYAATAPVDDLIRRRQYGLSMGICVGDIAAFLAIERLGTLDVDDATRGRIVTLVSREISLVGLAQMQDVHHGYAPEATDEAILEVYTYKTGRYTFSLPMMIGGILAGAPNADLQKLARLGEQFGRIFQIRDDQLGLFGTSDETGKPEGSDIREDKKTPFRNALLRVLPADSPVRAAFGAEAVGPEEIEAVRAALREHAIVETVERVVARDEAAARALIAELDLGKEGTAALSALLDYNLGRTV